MNVPNEELLELFFGMPTGIVIGLIVGIFLGRSHAQTVMQMEIKMPTRVWLAQCLCPQRHAILAAASQADGLEKAQTIARELQQHIAALLANNLLNPWCGLCRAPRTTWKIELFETRYATLEEAQPTLRKIEEENIANGVAHGELGR